MFGDTESRPISLPKKLFLDPGPEGSFRTGRVDVRLGGVRAISEMNMKRDNGHSALRLRTQPLRATCGLIPLLLWGVLACGLLFPLSSAFADACTNCQRKQKSVCAYRCDGSKNRLEFESCSKQCLSSACKSSCVITKPTPSGKKKKVDEGAENCADCIKRIEWADCYQECDISSPSFDNCRKTCAKKKCHSLCYMPDPGVETNPAIPADKYACERCKQNAESHCSNPSRCEKDVPGSVACVFACIQERCAEDCIEDNE